MVWKKPKCFLVIVVIIICIGLGTAVWESTNHMLFDFLKPKPGNELENTGYPVENLEDYGGETKRLTIYDESPFQSGIQKGWFAKVILEKFNIELDVRGISRHPDIADCDLIIWSSEAAYSENAELEKLEKLELEFVKTYSPYMYQKYIENFISADESGELFYGFKDFSKVSHVWSIGKNSEHKELVLCFIDWLASPAGRATCKYGPYGLCWEYDNKENIVLTTFGQKCREQSRDIPDEYGGGDYLDGIPMFSQMSEH